MVDLLRERLLVAIGVLARRTAMVQWVQDPRISRIKYKPGDVLHSYLKPDYGSVVGAREDQEELQDQDEDLINLGVAWTRGNPDTCRTTGPIITAAQTK